MRIATITNWAYGATVVLTIVSGTTMILASRAEDDERAAVEQRSLFDQLTASLEEDSYRLTDQARLFVQSGDPSHLVVYRREEAGLGTVEQRTARLRDAGAQTGELDTLKQGLRWADMLRDEQEAAIAAAQKGDGESARKILFGAEYERDLDRVAAQIDRFQYMLDQRTERSVIDATRASKALRRTSEVMIALTALMVLFVISFVIRQRILRPVVRLSDVVNRLAEQDYSVDFPEYTQIDEIGDMAHAIRIFRENGLERQRLEQERAGDWAMRDMLARMTQRLQGCNNVGDVAEVVRLFALEIAPALAGRLYVHEEARGLMVQASSWGAPDHSPPEFPPSQCWALRRGQLHRPAGGEVDIMCAHIEAAGVGDPICVPLTAQGETIGLLYFERVQPEVEARATPQVYLQLMAENVGLALANLRLRDVLRQKAMFDPLTGLSNRHRLETLLREQLNQAELSGEPLSCLMVDVDHFKQFNDRFGHDAGDAVLEAIADVLNRSVRRDGTAFRYGGEEFLLLMPGFDLVRATARAEEIRKRIKRLQIRHDGVTLGPISASIGIATYPLHGGADALVQVADAALIRAKEEGRDRIVAAMVRQEDIAS